MLMAQRPDLEPNPQTSILLTRFMNTTPQGGSVRSSHVLTDCDSSKASGGHLQGKKRNRGEERIRIEEG